MPWKSAIIFISKTPRILPYRKNFIVWLSVYVCIVFAFYFIYIFLHFCKFFILRYVCVCIHTTTLTYHFSSFFWIIRYIKKQFPRFSIKICCGANHLHAGIFFPFQGLWLVYLPYSGQGWYRGPDHFHDFIIHDRLLKCFQKRVTHHFTTLSAR